jgi:hypothetical protein
MYRISSSQIARTHHKQDAPGKEQTKGKQKGGDQDEGDKDGDMNHGDMNHLVFPHRRVLVRSLNHDSFSTITTAAETPDSSLEVAIVWDGKLPMEICIPKHSKSMRFGRFQKARYLPEPLLDGDDDIDEEAQEEDQRNNSFLPERLKPSRASAEGRLPPIRLHRSPSGGLDSYLQAPERFTRFEI